MYTGREYIQKLEDNVEAVLSCEAPAEFLALSYLSDHPHAILVIYDREIHPRGAHP